MALPPFFSGPGYVRAQLRTHDWTACPLGAPASWPGPLRTVTQLMLDSRTAMFLAWGPQRCMLYNDAYLAVLGPRAAHAMGAPLEQVWPDLWPQIAGMVERTYAGESFEFDSAPFQLLRDGEPQEAWFRFSYTPVRCDDGGVGGLLCAITETTGQVKIAEQLRASEAQFRTMTNASPQLVWSTNAEGRGDYFNERMHEFTGLSFDELKERSWALIHPDDIPVAQAAFMHARATGAIMQVEHRLQHHSGEYRWMAVSAAPVRDDAGAIVRWIGTCTDIHAHKLLERALKQARLQQDAALMAADIGTWSWDIRHDRVHADRNLALLFGLPPGEADGLPIARFMERMHPEDAPRVDAEIRHAVDTGSVFDLTYRVRRPDGSYRDVQARGKVERDEHGQPAWFPGIVLDVTARVATEEALRRMDRNKDEFLAMLAHELRNPLAPIAAAADLLNFAKDTPERVQQISSVIARQSAHMSNLIDDLLDVSRVTRGLITLDMALQSLNVILAEAIEQTRPQMEARGHHLELMAAAGRLTVYGDRKRLVQVFANLLNNAAKYTPTGGRILVSLGRAGHLAQVRVRDNGQGMDPELLAKAFDLFTQGQRSPDRSQGGLGLGLALVRSLVQLHGGNVHGHSDGTGRGSEFTVLLPLHQAVTGSAEASGPDTIAATSGGAGRRVLVVDDNQDAANMLALLLQAVGFDVRIEHDAQTALATACHWVPDVCVLDIGLPGMDGRELARLLRSLPGLKQTLLVAVSGYGQEQDRLDNEGAGFDCQFVKPVSAAALIAWIEESLPASA